jgi:NADH-quinone oxidoreductase subunit K
MSGEFQGYLAVGGALFILGALGFLTRRNLIVMMLSAEMMLHGVSLTFVTFGRMHNTLEGQAFTIFILTIAACEAGLALALILALYQKVRTLDIEDWTSLREPDLPSPKSAEERVEPPEEIELLPRLTPAGRAPELKSHDTEATAREPAGV